MPFDGTGFPMPGRPRRALANDNAVSLIIIAVSLCALLLPVSLAGFVDIVRYIQGR